MFMCFAYCHIAFISTGLCKECVYTHPPFLCIILLHYKLVVTEFPFSPRPFFNPSLPSQKRLRFFGNNAGGIINCNGVSPPSKRIDDAELS
jgi:hypothetical protein